MLRKEILDSPFRQDNIDFIELPTSVAIFLLDYYYLIKILTHRLHILRAQGVERYKIHPPPPTSVSSSGSSVSLATAWAPTYCAARVPSKRKERRAPGRMARWSNQLISSTPTHVLHLSLEYRTLATHDDGTRTSPQTSISSKNFTRHHHPQQLMRGQ